MIRFIFSLQIARLKFPHANNKAQPVHSHVLAQVNR